MYEKILRLCTVKGISIKALERQLNFGNGTILKWRTSSPGVTKLEMVADYFDVSLDYLLSNNPTEPSPKAYLVAKHYDQLDENQKEIVEAVMEGFVGQEKKCTNRQERR